MSTDPWITCEPQLNARLIRPLLRFFEVQFGRDRLVALARELGTTTDVLEDPDRWFSAELILRLDIAMVDATGDLELIYRAGRALAAPGMLGPERFLVIGLLSPRRVYERFSSLTARYSRITRWEMTAVAPGSLRAEFVPMAGAPDHLLFCGNRRGALEAVPEIFGLPSAVVEHPTCIHRGDARCVYGVSWVERPRWARPALAAALVMAVGGLVAGWSGQAGAGALFAGAVGFATVGGIGLTRIPVTANVRSLGGASGAELQELIDRSARRVHELQALQRVIEATRTLLDEDALIAGVLGQLTGALGYGRAAILRLDRGALEVRAVGFDGFGGRTRLMLDVLEGGRARVVSDVAAYACGLAPEDQAALTMLGFTSFVAAPIEGRGAPLGVILVDRPGGDPGAVPDQRDRDLLESVAATAGAAIHNARLYRQVQEELLINRKFRQYLPTEAADEILRDPTAALRLGGHEETVVVLFCDVVGFTRLSATCPSREVVRGLNLWFELADPIIGSESGIIDKRIGDGILVVFRELRGEDAVRSPADHPVLRAVRASLTMQDALAAGRSGIAEVAPAFAGMEIRFAIHYGRVILGNIGSSTRIEYTVIGDAVNTCARLEELTPSGEIWLTDDAVLAVGEGALPGAVRVGEVVFRGRSATTRLWRVGR